jgi:hypothetical protein
VAVGAAVTAVTPTTAKSTAAIAVVVRTDFIFQLSLTQLVGSVFWINLRAQYSFRREKRQR